jgi:hypothetical protein
MSPHADFSPEPAVVGGSITFKPIITFFNFVSERPDSPSKPAAKKAKRNGGRSTASEKSTRVRFRLLPLYQFLIWSRIPLMIARASR